jgi:acetylglutamate kinase
MKKYKLILDFLKIIEANRESKRYIKLFHRGNPARFAVVKLGGAIIESAVDLIAMDLAYLSHLDLYPIVVHGGGPQIDKALSDAGLHFKKKSGLRVTTKSQLPEIRKTLEYVNITLVQNIRRLGGAAKGLTNNIFIADKHPDKRFGYVGIVKSVNIRSVFEVIKSKKIPIVSCLGFDEDGNNYNINADEAAKAMVLAVKPKKYIIITQEGGIKNAYGKIIPNICLTEELPAMEKTKILKNGMLLKLREAKTLLEKIRYPLPIQLTSSRSMLKELFTDKGQGTFIKLGTEIKEASNWKIMNKRRVRLLIERSFGRSLKPGYFKKPINHIFVDSHYRGMSVIRKVDDMYYMDKFCVAEPAQGEGIARDIWLRITERFPNLFWRSRTTNIINGWYFERAQGSQKFNEWILFWINLTEDQIRKAKDYILMLEESILPNRVTHDNKEP